MNNDKSTERLTWKKVDGVDARNALVRRISKGDHVEIDLVDNEDTKIHVDGKAYLIGNIPCMSGYEIGSNAVVSITADVTPLEPPHPTWVDCQVVRDKEKRFWTRMGNDWWESRGLFNRTSVELLHDFGPITPPIDAKERPILSDKDLDRATLAVERSMIGIDRRTDTELRRTWTYPRILAALRETLGGAR